MKKITIIADAHLQHDEQPHQSYLIAKKFVKSMKPDTIVLLGDFLDFNYLSSYDELLFKHRENKRILKDYEMLNKELDYFQKCSKEIIYLEGNHEYRVTAAIAKNPNLEGLLEVPINLNLKERNIKWVPEMEQPINLNGLYLLHGKNYGIHFTKKTLYEIGGNCVQGHCHRIQSHSMKQFAGEKEYTCWGIGCLSSKAPSYLRGRSNHHMNGLAIVYVDGEDIDLHNIHINNNKLIFNNKLWKV